MILLCLALLAAPDDLDEVPLIAPRVQVSKSGDAAPPPPPGDRLFHAGIRAGGAVQTGVQRGGPSGSIELGVRLPFLGARFGFVLTPGVAGVFGAGGDRSTQGLWVSVPLSLSYHESLGPGALRIYAGPSLDWVSARGAVVGASSTAITTDRFLSLGATAAAGYVFFAHRYASLVMEAGYHFLTNVVYATATTSHVVQLRIGYAFYL